MGPSYCLKLLIVASFAAPASSRVAITTIHNNAPRLDNMGNIMDAHDMSLRRLPDGTYVMHAIEYGLCTAPTGMGCDQTPDHCGFRNDHNVKPTVAHCTCSLPSA
jgi:hypothetical protein